MSSFHGFGSPFTMISLSSYFLLSLFETFILAMLCEIKLSDDRSLSGKVGVSLTICRNSVSLVHSDEGCYDRAESVLKSMDSGSGIPRTLRTTTPSIATESIARSMAPTRNMPVTR